MQVKMYCSKKNVFKLINTCSESLYYGNAIVERPVSYPWIFPGTDLLFVELEDF